MRLRQSTRRRCWMVLSLPVFVVLGFLLFNVGSAIGVETQLRSTLGFVRGDNVNKARESGNASLATLRKQAEAAREQLQKATAEYRQGQQRLEQARRRLQQQRREVARIEARLDKLREPIEAIANVAYQRSPVSGFGSVFMSENPQATMRAAVDFAKLNREQQAVLREMSQLLQRKQALEDNAQYLAQRAQDKTAELKQKRQALQEKSQRLTNQLIQGMQRIGLEVSPGDRLPLGCSPEQVSFSGYPNGLIPQSALCPLAQQGSYLRADAAVAFAKLNVAYARHFGEAICVTDAYRSLEEQQTLYASKPGLAAVPGTSNHGLGLAVDLCGGIESFGTEEYEWMQNHARQYGWVHPDWASAGGSTPEPWHWEYFKAES